MADVKINIIAEDNFSSVLGNFGSIMTGIESVINLAKRAFDALVVPVIEFGKESLLASASVEELATVNRVLAEQNGINAASIPPLVEAIRAQGIEAGIAQSTVASFIKAQLDLSYATDLARIAQDSAVIAQTNSSEALDNIIYGITTLNPLVLRHAGIIVDLQLSYKEWADENGRTVESMTTAEKQQVALNAVMEYGAIIAGTYAAAMEEPGKVLRSFPRYFDDIKVAVGEPFQEAFGNVVFAFADLTKWVGSAVEEGGILRPILDDIGRIAGAVTEPIQKLVDVFKDWASGEDVDFTAFLASLGMNLYQLGDISPIFSELGESILRFNVAISQGEDPLETFKNILAEIGEGDSPLANIANWISTFIEDTENQGIGETIGQMLGNIFIRGLQILSDQIVSMDWKPIANALTEVFNLAITATLEGLYIIIEIIDWRPVGAALWNGLIEVFQGVIDSGANLLLEGLAKIFRDPDVATFQANVKIGATRLKNIAIEIGTSIVEGIETGINIMSFGLYGRIQTLAESLINLFKRIFGISSPSTVFMEIGTNIIQGLMSGILSMVAPLIQFLNTVVGIILAPFQPILDLLGLDFGGGGLDATGLGTAGGGVAGSGTLTSTATQNYYNYYYGPVYFQGTGQTNGGVDCQSPNPALNALGSSLPAMGAI